VDQGNCMDFRQLANIVFLTPLIQRSRTGEWIALVATGVTLKASKAHLQSIRGGGPTPTRTLCTECGFQRQVKYCNPRQRFAPNVGFCLDNRGAPL